ncbi:Phage tail sheath C-terminal domain containing protein [uncultured Caudovirales phage]|uniref:Phage tail sheath C-terminal domain containing protein n=1 Tax=uncultured Caudovirales phage TaxID=2100421 RepID=A0A6J5T170_9CAUD|nr:Phage tail sheath C-terminal domain containing protein [uncultured Caudovirales phage]CAB4165674.1 Phage tail sheath C-terminal domain containing protein [uncultured Caudovirales phage]CAB4186660.1 Phage tail sheath C-terminal domain containing protein [uncultured Caudovirales phage]CAB4221016.1 Phage tail sheath C-terminal domain containing protein [uncultured Caudovirales phage]
MALTSPGVQVTLIDESQYIPAATNSVPYILLATAQNKVSGAGVGVAAGTLKANANKVYLITSQRDLSNTFGVPFFYKTTAGTPINGYELNEYGLLAAYSALGSTNRAYVQRADIDLTTLTASLTRPTGDAANGTYWLDTASTIWGLFQWNVTTSAFTNKVPIVITDTADVLLGGDAPLQSIGSIGDYAVSAIVVNNAANNTMYFKRGGPTTAQTSATALSALYNTWVQLGSDAWKTAWPTVSGTLAPTSLTAAQTIIINGTSVAVPAGPNNTVVKLSQAINTAAITGVYSAAIDGKLFIYADSTATADGSTANEGIVAIANGTGTTLATLGITPTSYYAPAFQASPNYTTPRWRSTDVQPEPTGSVWQKTTNVNLGANLVLKKYSTVLGSWVQQAVPIYTNGATAIYGLDPVGGGINIPVGTTYARLNPIGFNPDIAGFEIFERYAAGATIITGDDNTPGPFISGNTFLISATAPGSSSVATAVTATLAGTTAADFISAVSAAAVPYVSASINSAGAIVFEHSAGGIINLEAATGTPIATAGFNITIEGVTLFGNLLSLSNFTANPDFFSYTASTTEPDQDPADGSTWYYSTTSQVDIMIQDDGIWYGYQNVTNDVRGDNLSLTNAAGPIFSATAPTTQTNTAASALAYGDLWIDTTDLDNYPVINRWSLVSGVDQWVTLNNTDQTTENGVLFADARWAPNDTTNPITGDIPTIVSLLTSNYLDLDAPDPALYPQGMLLFNTRRSGYNVKSFQVDYFNATDYPDDILPTETNAWVTASGNKADGSPYMGRQAQRALIVAALKAGIDASIDIREEQREFNLMACPQYPELIPNMVELNNDRNQTCFVIGDTPLRLGPDTTALTDWSTNGSGAGIATQDGLSSNDEYLGVFYPSCQTTDLSGSEVVQPPSHMMIRTIIRSDAAAYPWLAPAGTRRGVIDNAARIGYVNATTGEFVTIGVRQALRDVLYNIDINPITFVPGIGITNFGNKTATAVSSAMNRINVARLVAFIRARLESIGKQFLFEPNDQITRNEIQNAISGLMNDLIAKRGIYDYLVVCDLTNNTPARIDANELYVDIAIEPVKAVEFIYIPLRLKNTGEIAASIAATAIAS